MKNRDEVTGSKAFHGAAAGQDRMDSHEPTTPFYPEKGGKRKGDKQPVQYLGKRVGFLVWEGDVLIFERLVVTAKHLHKKLNAWGMHCELVDRLEQHGVDFVRIVTDTGVIETAPLSAYRQYGIKRNFGYGDQLFLNRRFFWGGDGMGAPVAVKGGPKEPGGEAQMVLL